MKEPLPVVAAFDRVADFKDRSSVFGGDSHAADWYGDMEDDGPETLDPM